MGKFEWEDIYEKNEHRLLMTSTARAKVWGGWVLLSIFYFKDELTSSMTFITDPEHSWKLGALNDNK